MRLGSIAVRAILGLLLSAAGACGEKDAKVDPLFERPAVHAVSLTIERSAMAELAREPREWVNASLSIGRQTYPDIAIRFKGHRSLRSWAQKPALKLAFDRGKHTERRVLGQRGFVLNNMVDDPSLLREQLGARVFAALGVPAPRATYAELTINGERFGLYSLLESIEDVLARNFRDASGPLYEGEYGCDLYTQDVWAFEHDSGEDVEREHLAEFAQRMSEHDARALLGDAPIVERERVLAYLAASTLLADFDGYRHGHNYRIYRDPGSERWSFIPWGFDRILRKDFAVFDSQGRVARVCFQDPSCRLAYVRTLQSAIARFEQLQLPAAIDELDRRIRSSVARDPRRSYSSRERAEATKQLAAFVAAQPERLRKQLGCWDGRRELDADKDGFGCVDCDDTNAAVHPGAAEQCDGIDNDCSGHVDDAASCGCPIERLEDASYALCDMPLSYWEAEQFCHSLGSTLAKLDSKAGLKQLDARTRAKRSVGWWVGLTDQAREGDYVWPDGSRPVRGLWARGEPDHYTCGQHCATLRAGQLADVHCATPAPFVCSADPLELPQRSAQLLR